MLHLFLYANGPESPAEVDMLLKLEAFKSRFPYELHRIDISNNAYLKSKLSDQPFLLEAAGIQLTDASNPVALESGLSTAQHRLEAALKTKNESLVNQYGGPRKFRTGDRIGLWFSRYYVAFFSFLLLIYVGLPVLAPVLMKSGAIAPAQKIYQTYQYLCHQLAFRSFFLFGEQAAYPREIANVDSLTTLAEATGLDEDNFQLASEFVGNEQVGYKIALCQRDLAIYSSMLLFGIVFGLTGRRFKPIPWYIWLAFGLLPIALDGGTQLVSQMGLGFLDWFPVRESTPFFRVLTGALFGIFTAWFGYPTMEETIQDARFELEKRAVSAQEIMLK